MPNDQNLQPSWYKTFKHREWVSGLMFVFGMVRSATQDWYRRDIDQNFTIDHRENQLQLVRSDSYST